MLREDEELTQIRTCPLGNSSVRRISRAGEVETLRPVLFVADDTATDDGPVLRQPRGVAANQSHLYIGVIMSATSH